MTTPNIYNTTNLIGSNLNSSMQSSENRIRTMHQVSIDAYGWRQMGLFLSAGGDSKLLTQAVVGSSGGTSVGA